MNKLGKRNYELISQGVGMIGTYNPDDIMFIFEEQLLTTQYDTIYNFLKWCHINQKTFGRGNYEERFKEFKKEAII